MKKLKPNEKQKKKKKSNVKIHQTAFNTINNIIFY